MLTVADPLTGVGVDEPVPQPLDPQALVACSLVTCIIVHHCSYLNNLNVLRSGVACDSCDWCDALK